MKGKSEIQTAELLGCVAGGEVATEHLLLWFWSTSNTSSAKQKCLQSSVVACKRKKNIYNPQPALRLKHHRSANIQNIWAQVTRSGSKNRNRALGVLCLSASVALFSFACERNTHMLTKKNQLKRNEGLS